MILLITLPLAIAISLCWYLPGYKALGNNHILQKKDYWIIGLKYGFAFTCLLIIVTEITWDSIVNHTPLHGLEKDIISNFFRAALLEEYFKFRGFFHAKQKYGLNRKIDYILTAGLIGMIFGIIEKIMFGNIAAVIVALICPMHIIWQFNQGGHYYEYEKAKAANDMQTAKKERLMALLVPFLLHGCWDSGLDLGGYFLENEASIPLQVTGFVLLTAMVVFGVIYSVRTVKNVRRIAHETPPASDSPAEE